MYNHQKKKERMRKDGDFSFIHKTLMQRVKKADGTWFIDTIPNKKGEDRDYYVYKAINAWGNGPRANEFYDVATFSEINNGYEPQLEASDATVLEVYQNSNKKKKYVRKQAIVSSAITIKGSNVVVGNKSFPVSMVKYDKLVSLGFSSDMANKIINEVNNPLKGCK